jgi:hypothetical protein
MSLRGVGATADGWPVPEDVTRLRDEGIADLKRAYRRLVHSRHPDRNPDDPEATRRFQGIHEAYATLEAELRTHTPRIVTPTRPPGPVELVELAPAPAAAAAYAACQAAWDDPPAEPRSFIA